MNDPTEIRGPLEVFQLLDDVEIISTGDAMDVRGMSLVAFQVDRAGTSHSLKPQGRVGSGDWTDLPFKNKTLGTVLGAGATSGIEGIFEVSVAGLSDLRLSVTAIHADATVNAWGLGALSGEPTTSAPVSSSSTPVALEVNNEPAMVDGWTEVTAATDNALATATKAAGGAGIKHYCRGVVASFSATVSGALLEIKDGATVKFRTQVYNNFAYTFPTPIEGTANTAMSAELAASGAGGTTGVVNLIGFTD
jgi:hypothetical protein